MTQSTPSQNVLHSPLGLRVVPFVLFIALTAGQGLFGEASAYWLYLIKSLVGIGLIAWMWPKVAEMRWVLSWEAIVVGVLVFAIWVGIDPYFTHLSDFGEQQDKDPAPWNPYAFFGPGTPLAYFFVVVRILGMTFVVPPLEEIFYRSFVYRYIVKPKFEKVAFNQFHWGGFLGTSLLFGITHDEWLSGILCGLLYQWLVIRKNRVGDAMTAHAITNGMLGCYVVIRGAWQFW